MLQILKMEEEQMKKTSRKPATKYAGLGVAIAAELMVGFWFGVGVILAIGVVDGSNYFIGELMSSGNK